MTLLDFILMIPGFIFTAFLAAGFGLGIIFGILCIFHFAGLVIKGSVTSIIGIFNREGIK